MSSTVLSTRRIAVSAVAAAALLVAACEVNRPTAPGERARSSSLAAVMQVQERHTPQLLTLPGVVGTATALGADGRPVLVVLAGREGLGGIPATLEGAPVEVRVTGEFYALQDEEPRAGDAGGSSLKSRIRPVPNGVSVSNDNQCAAGTLGTAVLKGGVQYALSNNHVFARENNAAIGEPVVQPGRYDNKPKCADNIAADEIGTLSDFEPINFSGGDNTIDAAIAQATATTQLTCATPAGFYGSPSTTTVSATVGMPIQKVGRTTGLTTGLVTSANASVLVGYRTGTATFVNQIVTTSRFSRAGDSGSLIVTNDGTNEPVGLLFAGSRDGTTIANPIDAVLSRFGATICHV